MNDENRRYASPVLSTAEAVTILRLIRTRKGHLQDMSGPIVNDPTWANEDHEYEYRNLDALDDKIARGILG